MRCASRQKSGNIAGIWRQMAMLDGASWSVRLADWLDETIFAVDAESGEPLQQQIRERLTHAIATGLLQPGDKAPSSRRLAERLGVSRNTVLIVYQQLTAEGYFAARERSGLYVADSLVEIASSRLDQHNVAPEGPAPAWRALMKRRARTDWSRRIPPDWALYPYPFLDGCFDRELAFIGEWREAMRTALAAHEFAAWSMDFSESDDDKLVREVRTKILPRRGIEARDDEILIVEGWKQGLGLIVQLLVDSKSHVALEDPSLPEIRELLRLQHTRLSALPVDGEGLVVDDRLDRCDIVIATPYRQAPTGVAMSRARQKALSRKVAANDGLIIELEAGLGGGVDHRVAALKASDKAGRVLYVSDLCYAFGPGLRLGVIVAPAEVIRELRKLRSLVAGPASRLAQRVGALLVSLGHHDSTAMRARRAINERLIALRDALNYYLPRLVHIDPKLSGSSIWVTGPPGLDASLLAKEAAKSGVLIEPASGFFSGQGGANAFRMGVSSLPAERIRPGVAALAKVMHNLIAPSLDRLDPSAKSWLDDAQLKAAMTDALLLCRTAYDDPYTVEVRGDGTMIGKAGYAHEDCDEGVWWIEDGHWCRRWNSWSYGDTARFLTLIDGDQIRWYKDDFVLFNRGVIVRGGAGG